MQTQVGVPSRLSVTIEGLGAGCQVSTAICGHLIGPLHRVTRLASSVPLRGPPLAPRGGGHCPGCCAPGLEAARGDPGADPCGATPGARRAPPRVQRQAAPSPWPGAGSTGGRHRRGHSGRTLWRADAGWGRGAWTSERDPAAVAWARGRCRCERARGSGARGRRGAGMRGAGPWVWVAAPACCAPSPPGCLFLRRPVSVSPPAPGCGPRPRAAPPPERNPWLSPVAATERCCYQRVSLRVSTVTFRRTASPSP